MKKVLGYLIVIGLMLFIVVLTAVFTDWFVSIIVWSVVFGITAVIRLLDYLFEGE